MTLLYPRLLVFLISALSLPGLSLAGSGDPVPIPADLSVDLTVEPTANLAPGDPVIFTLSVSNLGPDPVTGAGLLSSHFVDEIYPSDTDPTDCQNLLIGVTDGDGYYYYEFFWFLTDQGVLAVGETRSCHIPMVVGNLPDVFSFGFYVPDYYEDINPANDRATVYLRRGPAPAAAPIPALSRATEALLAVLLALTGAFVAVRRLLRKT